MVRQVPFNDSPRAKSANYVQYGTRWLKALYRGYTNSSFQTRSSQPPYQGTQGPTLRAEVGDMIEIMFCNKLSRNYASMHSMGLSYDKTNEGGDYPNNTMPGQNSPFVEQEAVPPVDSGVGPGNCVVYKWLVTWIMGPAPGIHPHQTSQNILTNKNPSRRHKRPLKNPFLPLLRQHVRRP